MTTTNVDALVARLQAHYASLGDGRDCRSANERADWYAASTTAAGVISALRNLPNDLAVEEEHLAALDASRAAVLAKRTEIEQTLADAPDPSTIANARERDQEVERQRQLRLSLELLEAGRLWRAPGQAFPPLAYLDVRRAELQTKVATLRGNLESAVAQGEALLAAATVTS